MAVPATNHRERILDASLAIILSKGFPATRVDEVCAAAGVTKGSFYHHFESKDALAHELVDFYFTTLMEAFEDASWTEVEDPSERLFAFLDHAMRVMKGPLLKRGCLLGSFALDMAETHPGLRALIEDRFEQLVSVVEGLIRGALKAAPQAVGPKPRPLARQFVSVLQGSIVMAKAYGDHKRLVEGLRCYDGLLRGMLVH